MEREILSKGSGIGIFVYPPQMALFAGSKIVPHLQCYTKYHNNHGVKDSRPTATEPRPLYPVVLSFECYRGVFVMDPLQTAALNALAPYLALCASANSPAAASTCISQAISAPNTYVFAELLSNPNIQALRSADLQHARWLRVLEIFSWGTWSDYQCEHASSAD